MTSHIRVARVGKDTDFAQKGVKWHLLRRTMMTGSQCGKTHNKGGFDSPPQIKDLDIQYATTYNVEQSAIDPKLDPVAVNNMAYGNNMEKRATNEYLSVIEKYYELQYPGHHVDVVVTPVSFYIHKGGLCMASPDGEVDIVVTSSKDGSTLARHAGVLEVKCPVHTYFAKSSSKGIRDPKVPITYAMHAPLLPSGDASHLSRKFGPSLPPPRLSISETFQHESDLYRTHADNAFSIDGAYSQYFSQCLLNLMLSDREFCDFFVWTSNTPSASGKSHTFWYKFQRPADPYPSVHLERIYRNDPAIVEQYMDLLSSITLWTQRRAPALNSNIDQFIAYLSREGGNQVELPHLDPAEAEDLCGWVPEEVLPPQEEESPSSSS